jgi:DNA-binding beta-propeller fold protein YncE
MVAGVIVDPQRHEIYTANNDIEDTVVVMSYEATGNAKPSRVFSVPHQAWGLALDRASEEIAVSVEIQNAVVFYRRSAQGVEAPVRVLRGPQTGLADPHGIYWDESHREIGVSNHGNFRGLVHNTGSGCAPVFAGNAGSSETIEAGQFLPPSITIYSSNAKEDEPPLRTIQGPQTELDWPMGVADDPAHNTLMVANNGDNSILIFDRNSKGDLAPIRTIRGERTGINRPMGVAMDADNREIWVSNYGDHSALVFDSAAAGNVRPKRILRSAPAGTATPGFGNPMALAYDRKREQILVPN